MVTLNCHYTHYFFNATVHIYICITVTSQYKCRVKNMHNNVHITGDIAMKMAALFLVIALANAAKVMAVITTVLGMIL